MAEQMAEQPDYALVDRLGAASQIFWPRADTGRPPAGARDLLIEVAPGVRVACRFWPADPADPSVLLFHGNGEVASDYDGMAPRYHRSGLNLMVADFRGYGASNGSPSFASLMADAGPVLERFHSELDAGGFNQKRLVMGRSLGAFPATRVALRWPDRLSGLIVESGASSLERLMRSAGDTPEVRALVEGHRARLATISLPTLVIHGERDELIPVESALAFFDSLAVATKEICIIPGAGHNDLWWIGLDEYFGALESFVRGLG